MRAWGLASIVVVLGPGCGLLLDTSPPGQGADAGGMDAEVPRPDAGPRPDAAERRDSGRRDAAEAMDAGPPDAGSRDGGEPDAGERPPDAGEPRPDAGPECVGDGDCDDSDACTIDRCAADGSCTNDPDPCDAVVSACTTVDCDDVTGCVYAPDDARCDPGEVCDVVDGCSVPPPCVVDEDCDDGVDCNGIERCTLVGSSRGCVGEGIDLEFCGSCGRCDDALGCVMDVGRCDDGATCTMEGCGPALDGDGFDCIYAAGTPCTDPFSCTRDECRPLAPGRDPVTGCVHVPVDSACDGDGASCTVDVCDPETGPAPSGCVARAPDDTRCADAFACTAEACRPGDPEALPVTGCVIIPLSNRCESGPLCTAQVCAPGDARADDEGCVDLGPDDGECDDGVDCTTDVCDPAAPAGSSGCRSTPDAGACDDGASCTTDTCDVDRGCVFTATASACDDGFSCTIDRCDPGHPLREPDTGCVNHPVDSRCGPPIDGRCVRAICEPSFPTRHETSGCAPVLDLSLCAGWCDVGTGRCATAPSCDGSVPCPDDGLACTGVETCVAGSCARRAPSCDPDDCELVVCDPARPAACRVRTDPRCLGPG